MIPREIHLFALQWNTYSALVALALVISAVYLLWQSPSGQRGRTGDVLLAAFIAGLLGGRVGHVWLWWAYFQDHTDEIVQITAGGLDWHGALVGGLFALVIVSHFRHIDQRALLAKMAFMIPLLGLATWAGCAAVGCAYGAQVESMAAYVPIMTWIAPDIYGLEAARFNVQGIGALLAGVLLVLVLLMQWRGWLPRARFWLVLMIWACIMAALSCLRGDDAAFVAGLRQDQWLDVTLMLFSLCVMIAQALPRRSWT
ncbi:prolipoprotein diacylglyceryl transferase [Phototrophicus methaneseepsis]|uniref:Prolipoprotein diacylglyceryl transferase n=1 Tax=Phototrophicus methaneseepsis TaxID=2710758 RepID=A0A7S8IED9_9CHLR|nr:prolipoprotein diacylglyceryl transferase family protein [Phototrophicus methaneseepsis]QPC82482.1 prolipoprotein diacylglyceryl transferase [Phototrophicus methaneseepsis]